MKLQQLIEQLTSLIIDHPELEQSDVIVVRVEDGGQSEVMNIDFDPEPIDPATFLQIGDEIG